MPGPGHDRSTVGEVGSGDIPDRHGVLVGVSRAFGAVRRVPAMDSVLACHDDDASPIRQPGDGMPVTLDGPRPVRIADRLTGLDVEAVPERAANGQYRSPIGERHDEGVDDGRLPTGVQRLADLLAGPDVDAAYDTGAGEFAQHRSAIGAVHDRRGAFPSRRRDRGLRGRGVRQTRQARLSGAFVGCVDRPAHRLVMASCQHVPPPVPPHTGRQKVDGRRAGPVDGERPVRIALGVRHRAPGHSSRWSKCGDPTPGMVQFDGAEVVGQAVAGHSPDTVRV